MPDVNPPDPTTSVGQVRLLVGDTVVTDGNYAYFTDAAITVALSIGDDSIARACSVLVKQLALQLTIAGQSIKADDFAINTLGKGKDLLAVADSFSTQADEEDQRSAAQSEGAYQIVNSRLNRPENPDPRIEHNFGFIGLFR